MIDNKMKTTAVKNPSFATQLIRAGFDLLNVTFDKVDGKRKCYIFERTEEFDKAFDDMVKEAKAKEKVKAVETETKVIIDGNNVKNVYYSFSQFEIDLLIELVKCRKNELKSFGDGNIFTKSLDKILEKLKVM